MVIKKWTDAEYRFVVDNRFDMTAPEMARYLNRTRDSVYNFLSAKKLVAPKIHKWTIEQELALVEWVKTNTTWKGVPIDKSYKAIKAKASKMNLKLKKKPKRIPVKKKVKVVREGIETIPMMDIRFNTDELTRLKSKNVLSRAFTR